jgi:nucleoside-diphosphate-sugar epimerase
MNLPMSGTAIDPAFWRGRRVLVTGHTGFIGGWTTARLHVLTLKASRIQRELGFRSVWSLKEAVEHTVAWYKPVLAGEDVRAIATR